MNKDMDTQACRMLSSSRSANMQSRVCVLPRAKVPYRCLRITAVINAFVAVELLTSSKR